MRHYFLLDYQLVFDGSYVQRQRNTAMVVAV
jgi:hypothetical protein